MTFTEKKFLSLPTAQQHKKCAHILRSIYDHWNTKEKETFLSLYITLRQWLLLPKVLSFSLEKISDLYHEHLLLSEYSIKEHNLLPALKTQDRPFGEDYLHIDIYLDHVRSAYNVGSILRTTEAMRLGSLYFSEKTPFIDNEKTKKTSMGTSHLVPCYANADLNTLPHPRIGLEISKTAISLHHFLFPESFTLVLGNEEYGISSLVLSQLDYLVEIPLQGCKNSINVACAFAIIAAEIRRQREEKKRKEKRETILQK